MNIDLDGREYATIDVTVDYDPTGTIELRIDDEWYPMTWTGASTANADGTYTRSAQLLVAGPHVDPATNPAGTVVLTAGSHLTAWRLTDDPELVVRRGQARIDVS